MTDMTYTLDDLPHTPTPRDYSRIQFDPSHLPKERIVGILACQRDPLLRHLRTRIVSAEKAKIAAPPPQKGKNKTRRAATEVYGIGNTGSEGREGTVLWEVVTEDTVIFPEGGGQPTDTGSLKLIDPNGGTQATYVVEGCLRRKLTAVHLVRLQDGEELVPGLEVELQIDWERRADHMAIHTAQHLLSAVLDTYQLPTLSWSMTQFPSLDCPYIELPRGLTWKEVEEVEDKCNKLISDDLGVWVETSMQTSVGANGVEGEEGDRESRGIPKDYEGGVIRHINIDGIDRNACCGTQVPSLRYCTAIHLLPPSIPSDSGTPSKSPTRLLFTAGPRALRYLRHSSRNLSLAAQAVGCGRSDLVERATRNEELRKEGADATKCLRGELAKVLTGSIARERDTDQDVVWIKRDERSTHDFEFMGSIASGVMTAAAGTAELAIPSDAAGGNDTKEGTQITQEIVVLVTSTLPGKDQTHLVLVQSNDQTRAKEVYEAVKNGLDSLTEGGKRVKGGGARGRFMGKVEGKWGKAEDGKIGEVIKALRK